MALTKKERMLAALANGPLKTGDIARAGDTSCCAAFACMSRLQAEGIVQRSKSGGKGRGPLGMRRWRLRPGAKPSTGGGLAVEGRDDRMPPRREQQ